MFEKLLKKYNQIIFFDTETTGFNPENLDQIIELAAVRVNADGSMQEMDEFIKLFRMPELPKKIEELTGISDDMLSTQGKEEEEVLGRFIGMLKSEKNTLLVAHNAQFDLKFMAYAIHRNKNKEWMQIFNDCDYMDTLTVYKDRRRYPHRLESAIIEYHLTNKVENSHRAIDDCKALVEVVKCMDEERQDLDKYINLFGFNPKYGPDEKQLKKVVYMSQSMDAYMGVPLYEVIKGV
nr:MAG TPA: DNA polymerase III subunit alpha [Caudoviricetes sp.]